MEPVLIGLNGEAESGKDTGFEFIREWGEKYNLIAKREAFADRLKVSAAAALGWDAQLDIGDNEIEFCNLLKCDGSVIQINVEPPEDSLELGVTYEISGREYLQFYGTEAHRDVFASDFWVDAVLPTGEACTERGNFYPQWWDSFKDGDPGYEQYAADLCVVTDVRFPNEAQRVKDLGGVVWKIDREVPGAGDHPSEQMLDPELIDLIIDNNGDLEDYQAMIEIALEHLLGITAAEQAAIA